MEVGYRSKNGSVERYEKRPPEKSGGRTLLSVTQVSRFQHVRLHYTGGGKVTQDPAGCFGGPRSEPPLPEDTRDYYSMRLSGSPPFACFQLREVYYRVLYPARATAEMHRRPDRFSSASPPCSTLPSVLASRPRGPPLCRMPWRYRAALR